MADVMVLPRRVPRCLPNIAAVDIIDGDTGCAMHSAPQATLLHTVLSSAPPIHTTTIEEVGIQGLIEHYLSKESLREAT